MTWLEHDAAVVVHDLLDLLSFIGLALSLRGRFGHLGVSAAVTGSSLVQMVLLLWFLRGQLPELRLRDVAPSALRTTIASLGAGAAGYGVARVLWPLSTVRFVGGLLPAAAAGSAFVAVFLVLGRLLGHEEQATLLSGLRRRLRRRAA